MGPLAQRDINRLAFKCWCFSSFGQHRNSTHGLVWQHFVWYAESEMSMSYIKERKRASCSEREERREIEKDVLEHDKKEFRSLGVELKRRAWTSDLNVPPKHRESPGSRLVQPPQGCDRAVGRPDHGAVFYITLYQREAGIPWRISCAGSWSADVSVLEGFQRWFQRCL